MLMIKGFFGVPLGILNLEGHSVNTYCKSLNDTSVNAEFCLKLLAQLAEQLQQNLLHC